MALPVSSIYLLAFGMAQTPQPERNQQRAQGVSAVGSAGNALRGCGIEGVHGLSNGARGG